RRGPGVHVVARARARASRRRGAARRPRAARGVLELGAGAAWRAVASRALAGHTSSSGVEAAAPWRSWGASMTGEALADALCFLGVLVLVGPHVVALLLWWFLVEDDVDDEPR